MAVEDPSVVVMVAVAEEVDTVVEAPDIVVITHTAMAVVGAVAGSATMVHDRGMAMAHVPTVGISRGTVVLVRGMAQAQFPLDGMMSGIGVQTSKMPSGITDTSDLISVLVAFNSPQSSSRSQLLATLLLPSSSTLALTAA